MTSLADMKNLVHPAVHLAGLQSVRFYPQHVAALDQKRLDMKRIAFVGPGATGKLIAQRLVQGG